jgi:1-acyl-sn-glycerol-3-phosphate acyltransferase
MRIAQRVTRAVGRGLLSRAQTRRLAALEYEDAGHGFDVFGMHRDWLGAAWALAGPLYRHYFRVSSYDAQHIPARGPAILVANHAGMLPIDGAMLCIDVFEHTSPPRMPRTVGDRFLPELPFVGTLFSRCGMVSGTPANVHRLIERGELCLIFPEGLPAIGKPFRERYKLSGWRVGHVELALRHAVPVIPVAVIGSEEQWPQIARIERVRPFGAPYLPIPATPLPLPVHYHIHYGPPIDLHATMPASESNARAIEHAAAITRAAVERLITSGLSARKGVFR